MTARHFLHLTTMSAILALACTPLRAQTPRFTPASLVPATFTPVTDSLGFIWDRNSNGGIGQGSNCFSDAFTLQINNNQFSAQGGMMTPDGSEYILNANMNGIDVSRRARVDVKAGFCRFIETLRNSSGTPQTLSVMIRVQFNNTMQATLSDTGAASPVQLGPKDCGIITTPRTNSGRQMPSLLWMLAGTVGKVRPSVNNSQNYRLMVTYPITLPPGGTVSFVHVAAQRNIAGNTDAKSLAKLFAPMKSPKLVADLTPKERKTLVNFSASGMPGAEGIALASLLEKLGVERGATDVLAIGADTRLRGTASCASLEIETRLGKAQIPFERVAAVIGGAREARVLLRDGQALAGTLTAPGLKFTLATGTTMELSIAALDRLVLRTTPLDAAAEAWGFVETFDGARIAVKPEPSLRLRANTAWGTREITPDELVSCGPSEDAPLQFFVTLKDGSRFLALLDGDEIGFDTVLFGRKKFPVSAIRRIAIVQPKQTDESDPRTPERSYLAIAGGQALGGQIDLAEVHFLSPGGVIPVAPNLIRTLHNTSEEASAETPVFTAELWGGGSVSGTLREVLLPVRSGGAILRVPARDVADAFVPSPVVPEGLRDKIAALVRDLGDPGWEKREAASRELGELGAMARAQLEETLRQSTDAEVRRRARALLDAIQG